MKPKKVQTGKQWIDEQGIFVDAKRLFTEEKVAEKVCVKAYNLAVRIAELLTELNDVLYTGTTKVLISRTGIMELNPSDVDAMNGTVYNFDKSVKIEKLAQKLPEYDKRKIEEAKETFDIWLGKIDNEESKVLVSLIKSAFETKSGKMDKKKLDQLISHEDEVEDEDFKKAIFILKEARNTDNLKIYYNISYKDEDGKYQQIPTRLSGITKE